MERLERLLVPIGIVIVGLAWLLTETGIGAAVFAGKSLGILLVVALVGGMAARVKMRLRMRRKAQALAEAAEAELRAPTGAALEPRFDPRKGATTDPSSVS